MCIDVGGDDYVTMGLYYNKKKFTIRQVKEIEKLLSINRYILSLLLLLNVSARLTAWHATNWWVAGTATSGTDYSAAAATSTKAVSFVSGMLVSIVDSCTKQSIIL